MKEDESGQDKKQEDESEAKKTPAQAALPDVVGKTVAYMCFLCAIINFAFKVDFLCSAVLKHHLNMGKAKMTSSLLCTTTRKPISTAFA